MKRYLKESPAFFLLFAIAVSFAAGFYFAKEQFTQAPVQGLVNIDQGKPAGVDFSLFWDTWQQIQEKSIQAKNLDYQKMVYGAISGMVNSLGDPYTVFMDPKDAKNFIEDVSGSFEGVGMEIGMKNAQLKVIAPLEGSPAQKAGLRTGDSILKIDDKSTADIAVDAAVAQIRGKKGTPVSLQIMREGWKDPRIFSITRDVVQVPSLKVEYKNEKNIAYIRIYHFSENAGDDFRKAVGEISKTGARKIILDLRGNPGGYLEVANDIAGWFIKRGDTVVVQDSSRAEGRKTFVSPGYGTFLSFPTVVLMDEGSASASEILAGALRDDRGIQLIGAKSFGKGSVQELTKLSDRSALKITIAHWLTPKGTLIDKKGLEPDVKVPMKSSDYDKGLDPQLDKAIEVLKGL